MKWACDQIGRFGFKIGYQFEPAWVTLWRRDDHYDLVLFKMYEDDDLDPVNSTTPVPFEVGDKIITDAVDNSDLLSWDESYNAENAGDAEPFTWSLDIADLEGTKLFLTHGMGKLPPKEQFDAVLAAVRQADPDFGTNFDVRK